MIVDGSTGKAKNVSDFCVAEKEVVMVAAGVEPMVLANSKMPAVADETVAATVPVPGYSVIHAVQLSTQPLPK